MSNDSNKKKITLTEEQATRAAEALLHGWLRNDNSSNPPKKKPQNDENQK
jgi:hypothetical protein